MRARVTPIPIPLKLNPPIERVNKVNKVFFPFINIILFVDLLGQQMVNKVNKCYLSIAYKC